MSASSPRHLIAHFSLAGTTARVAGWIADALDKAGHEAALLDLAYPERSTDGPSPAEADCLWVLSPVYAMHPAPAVLDFLAGLPEGNGKPAVTLAVYGMVCSGVALPDMGGLLQERGYCLAGAAKVVAEHSMMWPYDSPLGQGRPDDTDRRQVLRLVDGVTGLLAGDGQWQPLPLTALDYQSEEIKTTAGERSLKLLREMMPPITLNPDLCDECGLCAEQCHLANITLDPHPVYGDNCVACQMCVKACPTGALDNPMFLGLESMLRERSAFFGEPAETRVFLP